MKKIFTVISAVSVSVVLLAGHSTTQHVKMLNDKALLSMRPVEERLDVQSKDLSVMDKESINMYGIRAPKALLKDTTIELSSSYSVYYPEAFFAGISALGYVQPANLYIPYSPKGALFVTNYTKGTWLIDDQEVAKDTAYIIVPTGVALDKYSLPVLKSNDFVMGDTTLTFSAYQYGSYFNSVYADYDYSSQLDNASEWAYMTKCEVTTNVETYTYQGKEYDTYGDNWWRPWSKTTQGQMYGSGIELNFGEAYGTALFDTLVTTVDNSGVIAIEGVNLGIFGINYAALQYKAPVVAELHLTLYPLSYIEDEETGRTSISIDWDNPYATAVASDDDYVPYTYSEGTSDLLGTLEFTFKETDPDTKVETPTTVSIDGNFAAVLTGLNAVVGEKANDFGIMADGDYTEAVSTNTYFLGTTNLGKSIFSPVWSYQMNLLMNFAAVFPAVADAPEEIQIALAGGEKDITLNTNIEYDLMDIEADDWIDIDGESLTITQNEKEYFNNKVVLKITVPENATSREGKVVIDALGKEYTIVVKQGEATAVDNVKVLNDGKRYNLLGVEVDEDYNGIVIMNGKKFIQ